MSQEPDERLQGAAPVRATANAAASTVVLVLPAFLVGAFAVLIRGELAITEAQFGLSVAAFFATSSISSILAGRLAAVLGAWPGMHVALLGNLTLVVLLATTARSWATLTLYLGLAGLFNALGQPCANLAISENVAKRRQGISFAIKQTAPRIATLLAGLAVPVIGLTWGWRWGLALGAAIGIVVLTFLPRGKSARVPSPLSRKAPGQPQRDDLTPDPLRKEMKMLALASFCGAAAASGLGVFLVETAVAHGIATGSAGLLLAAGSAAGILSRLIVGWVTDRMAPDTFVLIAAMMTTGCVGFIALSAGTSASVLLLGTILGFSFGWGWNGLMVYLVVSLNPDRSAEASGVSQTGVFAGGTIGPAGMGLLITTYSYPVAWASAAVLILVAASLVMMARSAHRANMKEIDR